MFQGLNHPIEKPLCVGEYLRADSLLPVPAPPLDQVRAFSTTLRSLSLLFERVAAESSAAHGALSKQELRAVDVLGVRGPIRMGALADDLRVGQSAVTPLVDRLEVAGTVVRRQSEADRRVWHVVLTDAGEAIFQAERRAYERVAAAMLGPLPEADREALLALLARVEQSLDTNEGASRV
jgi:DNA-binding MarR family transcriptional regulator